MSEHIPLESRLRHIVREVPDFPQPGINFKDISPLLLDPALVEQCVKALAEPFEKAGITKVIGIESRGFLLGPLIAQELWAGFVIVRKKGKLPPATTEISYSLEYGNATIEMTTDALTPHDRVLIHDDLLATGGTAAAAAALVQKMGATVVGFNFLIELQFLYGREKLNSFAPEVCRLLGY